MKKVFKIRLYRAHDLDLIKYIESRCLDTNKAFYCVLKSYCKNEVFGIKLPHLSGIEERKYKSVYQRNLILHEGKDDDIIQLLSSIKPGYRNSFMKNLLRQYLCVPIVEDYYLDPKIHANRIESTFRLLQGSRRLVDISTEYSGYKEKSSSSGKKADVTNAVKEVTIQKNDESKSLITGTVKGKPEPAIEAMNPEDIPTTDDTNNQQYTANNHVLNDDYSDYEKKDDTASEDEDLTDLFAGIITN